MDIDPRHLDLMQREIDGCTSEKESALLKGLLSRHSVLRAEFDQLSKVADILNRAEQIDPPQGLRQDVLDSIEVLEPPHESSVSRWLVAVWPGGHTALRYGYTFIAGLALGFLIYPWSLETLVGLDPTEPADVVGTMTPSGPFHEVPLSFEGATGTARLSPTRTGWSVEFDIDPEVPLTVSLTFNPGDLVIEGVMQGTERVKDISITQNGVVWSQNGHGMVTVILAAPAGLESGVELLFFVSNEQVHRQLLQIPQPI